ncbi:MAG: RNA polymerase sigma factor [Firmicutes bacterium]|nr:RNA polymerase sigma factor [Bacillota bacterium]
MEIVRSQSEQIAQLYDAYGDMLFRLAYSVLLNRADAEDAVQDMFIKIIGKVPDFSDPSQERAWVSRVIVNQCRDQLRKRRLRAYTPLEELLEQTGAEPSVPGPEEGVGVGVLQMVLTLGEKYREPLILHYFEGFSVEEVGSILGIGQSAVKMRLSRGREMVKKRMEEEANE